MANIYGAKGRGLKEAFPPAMAEPRFYRGRVKHIVDGAKFANGSLINEVCYLGEVPSIAVINPASTLYFGAFGTSCTLDIGSVKDPDGLATLINVAAGGNSPILEAMSSELYARSLWDLLGYASRAAAPDMIDLYATIKGANVSTTTAYLTWNLLYSDG